MCGAKRDRPGRDTRSSVGPEHDDYGVIKTKHMGSVAYMQIIHPGKTVIICSANHDCAMRPDLYDVATMFCRAPE